LKSIRKKRSRRMTPTATAGGKTALDGEWH